MMTRHYLDLGSVCYRLKQISHTARPIGSTTQLWVSDTSLVWNCWAHFAQKLVVTKWNASCFFRLNNFRSLIWFSFVTLWNWKISINSLPKSKILTWFNQCSLFVRTKSEHDYSRNKSTYEFTGTAKLVALEYFVAIVTSRSSGANANNCLSTSEVKLEVPDIRHWATSSVFNLWCDITIARNNTQQNIRTSSIN